MSRYGYHWTPCDSGGGGGAALVVLVLVVIAAAVARPAVHAAEDLLEVAIIAGASVLGLAAIGAVAFLVLRAHSRQARNRQRIPSLTPARQQAAETLSAPRRRAIEAPRPSLADLQDLAARHGYDLTRRED